MRWVHWCWEYFGNEGNNCIGFDVINNALRTYKEKMGSAGLQTKSKGVGEKEEKEFIL